MLNEARLGGAWYLKGLLASEVARHGLVLCSLLVGVETRDSMWLLCSSPLVDSSGYAFEDDCIVGADYQVGGTRKSVLRK